MWWQRANYALVCETLKYLTVILEICRAVRPLTTAKIVKSRPALLYVMLYDHLFGKGIKGGGAVKKVIKENDVGPRHVCTCCLGAFA